MYINIFEFRVVVYVNDVTLSLETYNCERQI